MNDMTLTRDGDAVDLQCELAEGVSYSARLSMAQKLELHCWLLERGVEVTRTPE